MRNKNRFTKKRKYGGSRSPLPKPPTRSNLSGNNFMPLQAPQQRQRKLPIHIQRGPYVHNITKRTSDIFRRPKKSEYVVDIDDNRAWSPKTSPDQYSPATTIDLGNLDTLFTKEEWDNMKKKELDKNAKATHSKIKNLIKKFLSTGSEETKQHILEKNAYISELLSEAELLDYRSETTSELKTIKKQSEIDIALIELYPQYLDDTTSKKDKHRVFIKIQQLLQDADDIKYTSPIIRQIICDNK